MLGQYTQDGRKGDCRFHDIPRFNRFSVCNSGTNKNARAITPPMAYGCEAGTLTPHYPAGNAAGVYAVLNKNNTGGGFVKPHRRPFFAPDGKRRLHLVRAVAL